MIRDTVSATELDVLLYIAETPRTVDEIAAYMTTERESAWVRLCRMKKKDLVINQRPGNHDGIYNITEKGESLLVELAQKLKSFRLNRKAR